LAQAEGQLSQEADANQIAFEIQGLSLALHYEARFLHNPAALQRAQLAFEGIVQRYQALPGHSAKPATRKSGAQRSA
jgi:hypothetical protein